MRPARSAPGGHGLPHQHDATDRAAVADEVAIAVESVGAELHNAVDSLAEVVAQADAVARAARTTGWTHDQVEAAVDAASARARLRAVDRALAVLASDGPPLVG